jgi:hypothetical protein
VNQHGYYIVGDKIFSDKIEALIYASETRADVSWNFHDELFSKVNWEKEPSIPLTELYKQRALQIREKYDYIVLLSSGGADSTNMIYSFFNNNIHVDEIVASAPISGLSNLDKTERNNNAENTYNETFFAQIPLMKELSDKFSKTKFTLNDYFQDILDYKSDQWLLTCSDWIHPTTNARFNLEKFKHLRDIADSGKRLGIIYGIDKPNIMADGDNLYTTLADLTVNVPRNPFNRLYPNVDTVLFYYAQDLPELMVKQAHEVSRWMFLQENSHTLKYLRHKNSKIPYERNRVRQSYYERAIIPCIYKDTHRPVFQAHKCIQIFFSEHDNWFYQKHFKTNTFQMMESDFNHFINIIDPRHLNIMKTGFETFRKDYFIGKIHDFKTQV